jgi:SAM-dependent MidA family methyltransferase
VYFRPLGEKAKAEILAGAGRGTGEAEQYYQRIDNGDFTKYFVQANAAIVNPYTEAGISLRVAHVNFTKFESTRNVSGLKTEDLFFEPAAFVSAGFKNIRLESQFGYAVSFSKPSDIAFDYEFIRF